MILPVGIREDSKMKTPLTVLCLLVLFAAPVTWAQTSGTDDASTLADNAPADNVLGGAVQERAPGRWIDAARARHTALRDARLAAQRSGDTSSLAPESTTSGTSSTSGSTLTGLLSSLLGSSTGTSGTSSTGSGFSNLPPEVLQMLAAAGISVSDLSSLNQKSSNDSSTTVEQSKDSLRAQTTTDTTEERGFVVRWADAMLSTMFTSLAIAVQTTDFVTLLEDIFRPLFNLGNSSADATDGAATSARFNILPNAYVMGGGPSSGTCCRLC
jgi:hypothetical protein